MRDHVEGERDECLDDVEGVRDECLDDESEVAECGKQSDVTDVCDVDLGCPNLSDGSDLTLLKKEISEDESLKHCRCLATNNLMGYGWKDGLIYHRQCDNVLGARQRLVVPNNRRHLVVKLAYEYMGHLGSKKTRDLVNHRFTWPGLGVDIDKFVQSCDECARFNKAGNKMVQMVDRPILTEPYESVATDIVGPLPKEKEVPDLS